MYRLSALACLANLVTSVPLAPTTNIPGTLESPNSLGLTAPAGVTLKSFGTLNNIDPRFSLLMQYASTIRLPSLPTYMSAVETLTKLVSKPYEEMQEPKTFETTAFPEVNIHVTGGVFPPEGGALPDLPLPRKYAIWGIQQGLYQIGLRGLQNIYTLTVCSLRLDGRDVGTVVFQPGGGAFSPPIDLHLIGREIAGQEPAKQAGAVDNTEPASEEVTEQDPTGPTSNPTWVGRFDPAFAITNVSMPGFFNSLAFGLAEVAPHDPSARVTPFRGNLDEMEAFLDVRFTDQQRTTFPFFTNEWAAFGFQRSARAGADRIRQRLDLTQMEGTVSLEQQGTTTRVPIGIIGVYHQATP